jgi:hypothetical protein
MIIDVNVVRRRRADSAHVVDNVADHLAAAVIVIT